MFLGIVNLFPSRIIDVSFLKFQLPPQLIGVLCHQSVKKVILHDQIELNFINITCVLNCICFLSHLKVVDKTFYNLRYSNLSTIQVVDYGT